MKSRGPSPMPAASGRCFNTAASGYRPGDAGTSVTRASWVEPFLGLLDYELTYNRRAYELGGLTFAISHRAGTGRNMRRRCTSWALRQELGRAPAIRPAAARPPCPAAGVPQPHGSAVGGGDQRHARYGCCATAPTSAGKRTSSSISRGCSTSSGSRTSRLSTACSTARDCRPSAGDARRVPDRAVLRPRRRAGRAGTRAPARRCRAAASSSLANGFLSHPANHELRGNEWRQMPTPPHRSPNATSIAICWCWSTGCSFLLVAEDRGLIGASPLYREPLRRRPAASPCSTGPPPRSSTTISGSRCAWSGECLPTIIRRRPSTASHWLPCSTCVS